MINSYDKLPVGKYLEIADLMKQEGLTDIERQTELLAILNDTTADSILDLPLADYHALAYQSKFLESDPPKAKGTRVAKSYRLAYYDDGGERVEFELVPVLDIRKLTAAQYIDFQTFTKMDGKLAEVLSCLLVPKGRRYCEDYDPIEVQRAINASLSVTDALELFAFFLRKLESSTRATLICSRLILRRVPEAKRTAEQREMLARAEALLKSGAGRTASMK